MTCNECTDLLHDLCYELLEDEELATVEAHVDSCDQCEPALLAARQALATLDAYEVDAPAGLATETIELARNAAATTSPAHPWLLWTRQHAAELFATAVAMVALVGIIMERQPHDTLPALASMNTINRRYCFEALGRYLANETPGYRAVLVTGPMDKYAKADVENLVHGLYSGFHGRLTVNAWHELAASQTVETHELGHDDAAGTLNHRLQSGEFIRVLQRYPDCNLAISTVGIPAFDERARLHAPKVIVLGSPRHEAAPAIRSGVVSAAVCPRYRDDGVSTFMILDKNNVDEEW